MKITCRNYYGAPCWRLKAWKLDFHVDWNTRFPFGCSLSFHIGPHGFLLDLNGAFEEPTRLYLTLGKWHAVVSGITWWTFRKTGQDGCMVHGDWVRCRPHLVDRRLMVITRKKEQDETADQ